MSSDLKTQQLVLSIIEFLNTSIDNGTVKRDDREGLEVAIQCIGEAFGVDPSDSAQSQRLTIKPATLSSLFDVYLKSRDKVSSSTPQPGSSSARAANPAAAPPSPAAKAEAEKHKADGNKAMSAKNYTAAIDCYTKAVELDGSNPVYYSNRAAAYSSHGDHEKAIVDAQRALEVDSKFSKAYHRLGSVFLCQESIAVSRLLKDMRISH
jgi:tetratricopeptide (TPR) repeat protein